MNWLPAIGLALTVGAPMKESPKKAEPPSLVGEWECVEFIGGGRTATANEVAQIGIRMEFTADGKFRCREGKRDYPEGTYKRDPGKDPAEVDYTAGGIMKGNKGIYKVEKDTLTICVAEGGADRPTKFESPAGTRVMLVTFKRVEKKKE
jgi:uncharacterized protein (TIGR03067 family)